jgi:hypothetical protein
MRNVWNQDGCKYNSSSSIIFILKPIPIVEINEALNESSQNWNKIQVLKRKKTK